ncbi:MAG: hypothetical protein E7363_05830 [Clostridiales bacterium]|nr:hypothetical protein [Clostridiales bacterium]
MQLFILSGATEYSAKTKLLGLFGAEILHTRFPTATVIQSVNELTYPSVLIRDDYPLADKESVSNAFQCLSQGKTYEKAGVFALYSRAQIFRISGYPEGFTQNAFSHYVRRALDEKISILQTQGVKFYDVQSVYVEYGVKVEEGVVIFPNNYLLGNTIIRKNAMLNPGNVLTDTTVGESVSLTYTVSEGAEICNGASLGPFARLRKGAIIGENAKIGNFVEIKNSRIGEKVKIAHLTYVGDAEIGENTNVGCGVVFANFNGKEKQKTVVEKNCFLGCNVNLIAPVRVGENSLIAAGTTVTEGVPKHSFVIGRPKQITKQKE